jgi:hypothetical protein
MSTAAAWSLPFGSATMSCPPMSSTGIVLEGAKIREPLVLHAPPAPGRLDLRDDDLVRIVLPVRPVHHERPFAAWPEFIDLEGVGETRWSPPDRQAGVALERSKDARWRRGNLA